jgi:hypothetical protein
VLRIASPEEGATVDGATVRIVVVGEGGLAPATFRLHVDGRPVDATGTVGGVFTTLSVAPGKQLAIEVPLAEGTHQVTVTPDTDPDGTTQPPLVRRFTTVASTGGGALPLVYVGVALLVAAGVAVALRRKAAAAP